MARLPKREHFPELPLIDGNEVIDSDVDANDQSKLTQLYLQRSLSFLREKSDQPFFLYFAHTFHMFPCLWAKSIADIRRREESMAM